MVQKKVRELRPLYYEQFQCIGGACEDTCCAGWSITIDKKSYQNYKKETQPDLKRLLKENIQRNRKSTTDFDYGKFKLDDNNACNMLTEEGLCSIQVITGVAALCNTCQVYPRNLKILDGRSEKSLDVSCPEAARLILLNKDGIDFVEDYATDTKLTFSILNHNDPELEQFFWTTRMFFIGALQNRKHPIETRLMIIGLYVKILEPLSIEERFEQGSIVANQFLNLLNEDDTSGFFEKLVVNYDIQYKLYHSFIKNYKSKNKRFESLVNISFNDFTLDDSFSNFKKTLQENKLKYSNNEALQIAFENYLVNYTFTKYSEVNFDLFEFYSNLSIQFSLLRLFIISLLSKLSMLEEDIVIVFQSFEKVCSHNSNYIKTSNLIISETEVSKAAQAINIIHI